MSGAETYTTTADPNLIVDAQRLAHPRLGRGGWALLGVSMAALATAGPYSVHLHAEERERDRVYEEQLAASCGGLPELAGPLQEGGLDPLPPFELPGAASIKEIYTIPKIGEVVVHDLGKIALAPDNVEGEPLSLTDTAELPAPYRSSLYKALADPYITCLLKSGGVAGIDFQHNSTHEDAVYSSRSNGARLTFSNAENPLLEIFDQEADLRMVLIHEFTHAAFNKWIQSDDPDTQMALAELEELYKEEYLSVLESFRKEHGEEITGRLAQLKSQFESQNISKVADAINVLMEQYDREHGLEEVAFQTHPIPGMSARATIYSQIANASKLAGEQILELEYEGVNLDSLREAESIMYEYLAESYSYGEEAGVLPEMTATAGHRASNADETVASTVTVSRLAPDRVAEGIRNLPPQRRAIVVRMNELILELFKKHNPEAVPHLQGLEYVVKNT